LRTKILFLTQFAGFCFFKIKSEVLMRVLIVGAGIVGATIAYELSSDDRFEITVIDAQPGPVVVDAAVCATSTEAALGVLMAAIAKKEKGRNLNMRLAGVDWYDRVIPELIESTGLEIPYNRQGLLMLQYQSDRFEADRRLWESLVKVRPSQKRRLEIWYPNQIRSVCPQIDMKGSGVWGAVYSPDDRQVHPAKLTQALVQAAQQRGVKFEFGTQVLGLVGGKNPGVQTAAGVIKGDVVVVSAGLGSAALSKAIAKVGANPGVALNLRPVLGQAIQVRMAEPIGTMGFQPVITGNDIHLIAVTPEDPENLDYWVGATVEFGAEGSTAELKPDRAAFETLWTQACAMIPALESATKVRQWSGVRPRPVDRPAPVIEWTAENSKILLATGHYRNGVLLAPATAIEVRSRLEGLLEVV
jgi:glycine oxidase